VGQASAPANVTFVVSAPLPVTLTDFTAAAVPSGADLRWQTASETTNAGFTVQRSLDGTRFVDVTWVPAAGRANGAATYAYLDREAARAGDGLTRFYRLRQEDTNGTRTFSPVRELRLAPPVAPVFFPNPVPVGGGIELRGWPRELPVEVQVLTLTGQVLRALYLAPGHRALALADLPSGSYLLRLSSPGQPPRTLPLHQQ
jgi:hypothetical protein